MKTTTNETATTVEQQARICAEFLVRAYEAEYAQAERYFQQKVEREGYAAAYERSLVRLLRAEMQKEMLGVIVESCQSPAPIDNLEQLRAEFRAHLVNTVRRNDGTPEQNRLQALRAECQGWALEAIAKVLGALQAVRA
ncbi:MAG: hypothetical protein JXB13_08210 [Phycisphaerae bacterium]|nr:hypothetical protein [Phycisphaerae bacterium]